MKKAISQIKQRKTRECTTDREERGWQGGSYVNDRHFAIMATLPWEHERMAIDARKSVSFPERNCVC